MDRIVERLGPTVLILAGGLGTRLRSRLRQNQPKPMVQIGGKPFLEVLINKFLQFGMRDITLCLGHEYESVVSYFRDDAHKSVKFSVEKSPLGTGGAVKLALRNLDVRRFLVINADTIYPDNFYLLAQSRLGTASSCIFFAERFGQESVDEIILENNRVVELINRKPETSRGQKVYAGASILDSGEFLRCCPHSNIFSLERDILPLYVKNQNTEAIQLEADFHDFGTPERLDNAWRHL